MRGEPTRDNGRLIFPPPTYRCFELKTSKVTRSGEVKSLKTGKFHKTRGQLEKLCDIGAQQVFLLEAFIVEAGYTVSGSRRMPAAVRDAISVKYEQIMRADYGYATMGIEQIPGFSEHDTGVLWPTETIKGAKTKAANGPFLDIVKTIEVYIAAARPNRGDTVVTYCYNCRKLTHTRRIGPYSCRECKTPFV